MKIPASIRLAAVDWEVRTVVMQDYGSCDPDECVIKLRKGLRRQVREATFCHELVHALLFSIGEVEHDETRVQALGNLIHQYLSENA